MSEDIYIVTEIVDGQEWYVAEYSISEKQVGVSTTINEALKFNKQKAEYIAEYFGMMVRCS